MKKKIGKCTGKLNLVKDNIKCPTGCGKISYIFGFSLCFSCYMKFMNARKKEKNKIKLSEKNSNIKKPILKQNNNTLIKTNKTIKQKKKTYKSTGEIEIFKQIWNEREHISCLTGINLEQYNGTSFFINCFAHILPKSKYKHLRLNKDNIILLTPEEHFLFDFGTIEKKKKYELKYNCNFDEIKNLVKNLI